MNTYFHPISSLKLVRNFLYIIAILAFLGQVFVDGSFENWLCSGLAFVIFVMINATTFRIRNNIGSALITTVVFLMTTANSLAAMVGTLLEGHSLTYSLIQPVSTFLHRSIFGIVLMVAYLMVNSNFSKPFLKGMSKFGVSLNSSELLSPRGVWGLAAISVIAYLAKHFPISIEFVKIMDGLGFLLWSPFVLLVYPYSKILSGPSLKWQLGLYYIFQICISLANNSRMGIIGPVAVVGSAWLVTLLLGHVTLTRRMIIRFLTLGALASLLAIQFSDFSTAILIERENRSNRDASEQLSATFNRFLDKKSLDKFRMKNILDQQIMQSDQEWQENYIQNDFLGRFVQIKFDDNCFYRISFFYKNDLNYLNARTTDKILVLIPTPFLKLFEINIDKQLINSYSVGDLIDYLSGGFLEGFKTGSIPAHAFALYGWWYPLVLLFLYYIIFCLWQGILTIFTKNEAHESISTIGLLLAFKLFSDISVDGVTYLYSMLFRDIWQISILYCIVVFTLSTIIAKPIKLQIKT